MILDKESDLYLKDLLKLYLSQPDNCLFDHVIQPPVLKPSLPSVFVWCPVTHYNAELFCSIHKSKLHLGMWTDDLITKHSVRNPRLIFSLFDNIVLVQRFYVCRFDKVHRILSSDIEIIKQLPDPVKCRFSYIKHHQTMFSYQLVDYIFDQVVRGISFSEMTEAIGVLKYNQYMQKCDSSGIEGDFLTNIMYSFPGNGKLIEVFLDVYQRRKSYYDSIINQIDPGSSLSSDYDFIVGKVVPRGGNAKSVLQFNKVFIVSGEQKQIVGWKLCSSTSPEEVRDVFTDISARIDNTKIQAIFVDDCCSGKNVYEELFPYADVKLDISHALECVTSEMPDKKSDNSRKWSTKLSLIFREDTDQGFQRSLHTADPATIMKNLVDFSHQNCELLEHVPLTHRKTMDTEIEKLALHIQHGCLSNIPPRKGSEANEGIHRLLNRSLLARANTLSPDLARAVLAVIFHHFNGKLLGATHKCNSQVVLFQPPRKLDSATPSLNASSSNIDGVVEDPERVVLIERILKKISSYSSAVKSLDAICYHKDFKAVDAFLTSTAENVDDEDCLERNLLSLKLNISVWWDGEDSLFFALAIQLLELQSQNENMKKHLMPDGSTEALSLKEIILDYIKNEMREITGNEKNVLLTVAARVLKLVIIVVSSKNDMDISIFVPLDVDEVMPLVILGCNSLDLFCSTTSYETVDTSQLVLAGCGCGRSTDNKTCSSDPNTRCKCAIKSKKCDEYCKCKSKCCLNREVVEFDFTVTPIGATTISFSSCSCGRSRKRSCDKGSCGIKCPCYRGKSGCGDKCSCFNCINKFGIRDTTKKKDATKKKAVRRRSKATSIKRPRKSEADLVDIVLRQDDWSDLETIALFVCQEIIEEVEMSSDDGALHSMYNMVASHENGEAVKRKGLQQVTSKRLCMKRSYMAR